jgi:glycerol kinase
MPKRPLILAVDQSTSNTKVIFVDARSVVGGGAARRMDIECPQPGWVQQHANAIWAAVRECVDEVLSAAGSPALAAARGITTSWKGSPRWRWSPSRLPT